MCILVSRHILASRRALRIPKLLVERGRTLEAHVESERGISTILLGSVQTGIKLGFRVR